MYIYIYTHTYKSGKPFHHGLLEVFVNWTASVKEGDCRLDARVHRCVDRMCSLTVECVLLL